MAGNSFTGITDDTTFKFQTIDIDPPLKVRILAEDQANQLMWAAAKDAPSYNIYRSTTSGRGYTKVGTTTSLSFTNTGLTNGILYFYVVRSLNVRGSESSNSKQISGRPVKYVKNKISSGEGYLCGITNTGQIKCWGSNDYGQLGDGTMKSSRTPKLVSGKKTYTSVSAGHSHTCGITNTGQIKCWGTYERDGSESYLCWPGLVTKFQP